MRKRLKLRLPFRRKGPDPDPADGGKGEEGLPVPEGADGEAPKPGFEWTPPATPRPTSPPAAGGLPPGASTPGTPTAEESPPASPTGPAADHATTTIPTLAAPGGDPENGGRRRWRTLLGLGAGVVLIAALGAAGGYALSDSRQDDPPQGPAPAPTVVVKPAPDPEAADEIGFPAFATLNTTRVGGANPIANAAGIALASYPTFGDVGGPDAVALSPASSWQAALAASSLSSNQIGAPLLLSEASELPGFTADALQSLAPAGIERASGTAVIAIGDVATPEGLEVAKVPGTDPAELAKGIDRQRARLSGTQDPDNILVVSSGSPAYAMPAAAWSARSGDPILFAESDAIPKATIEAIERHPKASIYVLGPESVIDAKAFKQLEEVADRVIRIQGKDPETNAINFARFVDGGFGWNINDPGHGFVIANTAEPIDAGAAASLSANGKPGPLLVTEQADEPSKALRNFLLDTKPGFSVDPSRALFNHVWLVGNLELISVPFQAQVDELVALERISPGSGVPDFGPDPGSPEPEIEPKQPKRDDAPAAP